MCSCDDGETAVCYSAEWVEGRKEHKCCECRKPIATGTLHRVARGLWEGSWDTYRLCARCDALHEAHRKAEAKMGEFGCSAPLSMLLETIRDCATERQYAVELQAAFRNIRTGAQ